MPRSEKKKNKKKNKNAEQIKLKRDTYQIDALTLNHREDAIEWLKCLI